MASISMAASTGSTGTATVVRAWRPFAPNTANMRSDAPFITTDAPGKSGQLMKPPSRTTRSTLSRSPSAILTCARRLIAQTRAAA